MESTQRTPVEQAVIALLAAVLLLIFGGGCWYVLREYPDGATAEDEQGIDPSRARAFPAPDGHRAVEVAEHHTPPFRWQTLTLVEGDTRQTVVAHGYEFLRVEWLAIDRVRIDCRSLIDPPPPLPGTFAGLSWEFDDLRQRSN